MFVSLVYDSRDANTEHPESSLGASDTVEEAWDEIVSNKPRKKPMDKHKEKEAAAESAVKLISESSYGDLLVNGFTCISYEQDEIDALEPDEQDWVGQYVRGSVDASRGLTVLLAIDPHEDRHQMLETILHEAGHALWELLDDQAKQEWKDFSESYWGPEEEFADAFMDQMLNRQVCKAKKALFEQITAVTQATE